MRCSRKPDLISLWCRSSLGWAAYYLYAYGRVWLSRIWSWTSWSPRLMPVYRPEPGREGERGKFETGRCSDLSWSLWKVHRWETGVLTDSAQSLSLWTRARQMALGMEFSEYFPWKEIAQCCCCCVVHMSIYSRLIITPLSH